MSTLKVSDNLIAAEVEVPSSKSYANRALILASLSSKIVTIKNIPDSQDVIDLISLLQKVGLDIQIENSNCIVKNSFPECELDKAEIHLNLGQGGTTSRFIVALLALGKCKYILDTDEQLKRRPIDPLLNSLEQLDVKVIKLSRNLSYPIQIQGPISSGKFIAVDSSTSSQFASALMLISKKADIQVDIENKNFSLPYIGMTLSIMENNSGIYNVPADFSSISYLLSYYLLNKSGTVKNVGFVDKTQADSVLVELVNSQEHLISLENGNLLINKSLKPISFHFNASNCPDLVPSLVYMGLFAGEESRLCGLKILKYKETDRLEWIQKILKQINATFSYDEDKDELVIAKDQSLTAPEILNVPDDHRMVMMGTLILKQLGGGVITNHQAVKKSFPNFFDIF